MDDGWEPWRFEGYPNVGDYVQAEVRCICQKLARIEGIVAELRSDIGFRLIPSPKSGLCLVEGMERWRRRKPPADERDVILDRELEDA